MPSFQRSLSLLAVGTSARAVSRIVGAPVGAAVLPVAVSATTPVRVGLHVLPTIRAVCSLLGDFAAFATKNISYLNDTVESYINMDTSDGYYIDVVLCYIVI